MVVMTAKIHKKKLIAALFILAALVIVIAIVCTEKGENQSVAVPANTAASNEDRIAFLKNYGWELNETPINEQEVKIPNETTEVLDRYNELQQSQGYDLTQYAGKNVTRYVYEITNYPDTTDPVYATLLVYKDEVVGGDITSSAPNGKVHGFAQPKTEN